LRGIAATRVVKTGSLGLRVAKGQVGVTVAKLTTIASGAGGYVSRSHTGNVAGAAYGSATLRVPVNRFAETVAAAGRLGKQTSLTTSSQDVTGEYVDLRARLTALEKTRQTYLTILGHARTIGQTLAVQQHVNDIQQQIEERQGELKVLRNQSSDATLQVSVSEPGSPTTVGPGPKPRHGLNKAWHTSIDRFSRGIDSIVAALGPLLLALLVVAAIGLLGFLGYRVVRRVTASA
ncbi:MAG TPA: DUF4349 domain-containing protein, partial [Mycobacteriales bacterium]|nr:DUF4349 domain-containing protein [Mycobacteriales bacterium]